MQGPASVFSPADFAGVFGRPARRPWMTWLLTGLILTVYVAQLLGRRHGFDRVGTALAFGPGSLAQHRYWTLLTYAFAHAVPGRALPAYAGFHLVTNIVPFFCVTPAVERRCGPWWLLAIFIAGAAGSAFAWDASHPRPNDAMIGASGALFAIITAGGAMRVTVRGADLVFHQLPLRIDLRSAAIVLCVIELVQMFFRQMADVAHVAHLGGALVGLLLGLLAARALKYAEERGKVPT